MKDLGPTILGVLYTFLVLSLLTVGARCYTRVFIVRGFGIDDGLLVLAMALYIMNTAFSTLGVYYGLGRHTSSLTLRQTIEASKWLFIVEVFYVANTALVKLSVGSTLLRLGEKAIYKYIIWAALAINIVICVIVEGFRIFSCSPVDYNWKKSDPTETGHCLMARTGERAAYAFSGITIFLDFLFAILPVFMLWNLKMSWQVKSSIMFILSLGVFATIANFIRLKSVVHFANTADELFIWSIVEAGSGMVASSLATLRPLVRKLRINGFGDSSRNTAGYVITSRHTANRNCDETYLHSRVGGFPQVGVGVGVGVGAESSSASSMDSQEHILDDGDGITKRTDVYITRA
ncbi:hypothetical protein B7494_g6209 [Chlorociboria aeruginascens]|nr:hypothetical protein B7494_g6209 [Chlorociboria aeruginascens]